MVESLLLIYKYEHNKNVLRKIIVEFTDSAIPTAQLEKAAAHMSRISL